VRTDVAKQIAPHLGACRGAIGPRSRPMERGNAEPSRETRDSLVIASAVENDAPPIGASMIKPPPRKKAPRIRVADYNAPREIAAKIATRIALIASDDFVIFARANLIYTHWLLVTYRLVSLLAASSSASDAALRDIAPRCSFSRKGYP